MNGAIGSKMVSGLYTPLRPFQEVIILMSQPYGMGSGTLQHIAFVTSVGLGRIHNRGAS